jgi:CheY-like chemotaxis protein
LTQRILIIESDPRYGRWLSLHAETVWPESQPGLRDLSQLDSLLPVLADGDYDVLLLSISFATGDDGKCEGYEQLRKLRRHAPQLPVIAIASDGDELTAVKALRLGASDYLPRRQLTGPLLDERLQALFRRLKHKQAKHSKAPGTPDPAPLPVTSATRKNPRPHWPHGVSAGAKPVIPHYSLLRQIGDSPRASVWLANSEPLQKIVAVKISKSDPDDTEGSALFAREYAAISALNHPGIVEIYDYGVHDHHEYLAMEYFPSGDLKQRLQKPVTPAQCVIYLQRIAGALQPVHAAGMMHLDLKPANIMLREDGSVVLIDFGLVKRMGSIAASALMGIRRGSPYYMSPEQVHGLPLDARSDIYSLGVIFYEMLTSRRPFVGTSAIELMESHVKGQRPALPTELSQYEPLVAAMMATAREERVADAGALLQLLLTLRVDSHESGTSTALASA